MTIHGFLFQGYNDFKIKTTFLNILSAMFISSNKRMLAFLVHIWNYFTFNGISNKKKEESSRTIVRLGDVYEISIKKESANKYEE